MTILPFFLDRSRLAKLIRSIGRPDCSSTELEELVDIMRRTREQMPYGYLDQILRRSEGALAEVHRQADREMLDELKRSSLWRMQRIHLESRP